ncbi:hypothetical protein YC2023_107748 [Brassica napus]
MERIELVWLGEKDVFTQIAKDVVGQGLDHAGCVLGRYVATKLCALPRCVRARSLRNDRALCVLGRYIATELCNRFAALPFSTINLGVFCGFWENKFYPSQKFSENVFW